jgi:predicted AAA+ superfamily ATPase
MLLKSGIARISELQSEIIRTNENDLKRESVFPLPVLSKHALIITGIRRCGKSTLLFQIISEKYPEAFFLNFDDNRLYGFENSDFSRLDEVISESGRRVLFFDELQEVEGWERYVRQKLDENYQVVITGSNASLLSKELGTKLTGRYIAKELFPFSFNEFKGFESLNSDEGAILKFLKMGGFPEYLKSKNPEILGHLFDDILIRDIVVRYGIRDIKSLQRLALYLVSNTGNPVTGSKLKHAVGISATSTIMEYFSYLESAYLFYFVPRFSYSAKSQMINPRKVYCVDPGLITVNSASFSEDNGRKLENIVYNYLRSLTKEIYYFQGRYECDFIVTKRGEKPRAIQVCYTPGKDNLERELGGLYDAIRFLGIKEGIIITLNQKDKFTKDGLTAHVLPAAEFLSGTNPVRSS